MLSGIVSLTYCYYYFIDVSKFGFPFFLNTTLFLLYVIFFYTSKFFERIESIYFMVIYLLLVITWLGTAVIFGLIQRDVKRVVAFVGTFLFIYLLLYLF